jgi:glycosyltransferase involved in cell wall biosynthesis
MEYRIAILISGLGVDGVTHEAYKKKKVLEDMGHYVKIITGRKNKRSGYGIIEKRSLMDFRAETHGIFEPVAFPYLTSSLMYSSHPKVKEMAEPFQSKIKSKRISLSSVTEITEFYINVIATQHEQLLNYLFDNEKIDIIIPENILSMPMQLPLAVALTKIIKERNMPTIASHHDFYFERKRFRKSTIPQILRECYPPDHECIRHIVINSRLHNLLKYPKKINYSPKPKKAIDSIVLPNTFDFDFEPEKTYTDATDVPFVPRRDTYNRDFREQLGFAKDDVILLQNTRIVSRKNIERSIDILKMIKEKRPENADKYKLVISLSTMDEGNEYYDKLIQYIRDKELSIGRCTLNFNRMGDVVFTGDRVSSTRRKERGKKIYHYLDTFPHCDFVFYPSAYEGWGNVIGEAVQAKKPMLINKFPIYISDIKKYGFKFIEINDKVTPQVVSKVLEILEKPGLRKRMVDYNFKVGKKNIDLNRVMDVFEKIFKDKEFMDFVKKRRDSLGYIGK